LLRTLKKYGEKQETKNKKLDVTYIIDIFGPHMFFLTKPKFNMRQIFTLALLVIVNLIYAQVPTDQDCLGAIPVCQEIYVQENSYSGTGNYPNEIPTSGSCPGNCMSSGEKNDVWYIFTVQTGGDLGFNITPNNNNDDYDWAVYHLDQYDCEDLYAHINEMQVSCNWSGTRGLTGPNGNSNYSCQSAGGSPHNALIPVNEGETYVINISNYSSTQYGYTLDFSMSTAEIYDDVAPELDYIYTDDVQCGTASLTFDFTEKVLCNSVQANDFTLSGPGGEHTITSIFGEACSVGGQMEQQFMINFTPAIYESGEYFLTIKQHSYIQDACGNIASTGNISFTVDLNSPTADAGEDINIAYAGTTLIDATINGGSGNFDYDWEPAEMLIDPTIEDPTTVNLTESTQYFITVLDNASNCMSNDDVWVNVVGGPMSINVSADLLSICSGEQINLDVLPSGGSGDYLYSWTSDPPGFVSDIQSPSANPEVTTTYFVEVTDGYTTLNGQVAITVYETPLADAGEEQTINVGTPTTLDGSASGGVSPYAFWWEPAGMINGPNDVPGPQTVILEESQLYSLVVTDDHGCPSEVETVLILAEGGALSAYPQADPPEICIGQSTVISANALGGGGSYTYSWTSSTDPDWSAAMDGVEVSPEETTTYYLELNDGFTIHETHIIVPVHALPEINLAPQGYVFIGEDTVVACVNDTVVLDAGNDEDPPDMLYSWSNNWAERYMIAKTNGNWVDWQTHAVEVTNPYTTCVNNASITVLFSYNECEMGTTEIKSDGYPFKVLPNPSNDGLFYFESEKSLDILDIKVYSVNGALLMEKSYRNLDGYWRKSIDLTGFTEGMYFFLIRADEDTYSLRVIIN